VPAGYGSGTAQEAGVPVGHGSSVAQEAGIQAEHGCGHPRQSWGPAEPIGCGWRSRGLCGVWIWHGPRAWHPGGVWIQHGAKSQHGLRGRDPGGGGAWMGWGAVAQHSPRGRKPGRAEQWLCRPMGQKLGRSALLLLDHGMEKPSMI
jgi:hypothetical protein